MAGLRGPALLLVLLCFCTSSHSLSISNLLNVLPGRSSGVESNPAQNFRMVQLENLSVIYERYEGETASHSIHVASFSDPSHIIPAQFKLRIVSEVQGSVFLQCSNSVEDVSITSFVSGLPEPRTELRFDFSSGNIVYTVAPGSNSSAGQVETTVNVAYGRLAKGSSVVLSSPHSNVKHSHGGGVGNCKFDELVDVEELFERDLCTERSEPCEQVCDAKTGSCACHPGYIVDEANPERCLDTYQVTMTIPGLERSAKKFSIIPEDMELVLAADFRDMTSHVGIHHVAINMSNIDVTTLATADESAEKVAHRLRRALSGDIKGTFLGITENLPVGVRVRHPIDIMGRKKRQASCARLDVLLTTVLNITIDFDSIILPTDFSLASLCTDAASIVSSTGQVEIPIPVPDAIASTLLPDNIQLKDTILTLTVTVSPPEVLSLIAATKWVVGNTDVNIKIVFNITSGTATITGDANGLSISDLFSIFSPSFASDSGLSGVSADEVGFMLTAGRTTPTRFYFRLLVLSARDLATNLIGAAGLPTGDIKSALEAANLDSFDITNVEVLVTNEGGRLCVQATGTAVLEAFQGVGVTVQIKAIDVGTTNKTVTYAFSVDGSINLAAAIKGFIPPLDLTGIPGIGTLQLPEFAISIRKPKLPGVPGLPGLPALPKLPDVNIPGLPSIPNIPPIPTIPIPGIPDLPDFRARLPKIRAAIPKLNIPRLKLPGVNFNALFRPNLPNLPDALSIGGGLGLGPLCLNLKDNADGSAASLTEALSLLFPDLADLTIPAPFEQLLNVQLEVLCLNRTAKTFTAAVRFPSTIEIIPSKPGFLSLTDTTVGIVIDASRRPVRFDFAAASTTTIGGFPLTVSFNRARSGAFTFKATPVQDILTTGDIVASFGDAGSAVRDALNDLQLADVALSGLELEIFNKPVKTIRFTATVSFRDLPSVSFEFIAQNPFTKDSLLAVGIQTTSATLAKVVSSVLPSVDIADVPFVGDFTIPAVGVLLKTKNLPSVRNLPFANADLKMLAANVSPAKISMLFPVNFPRVGRKNFVAAFKGLSFDFMPPDSDTSLLDLAQLALPGVNLDTLTPPDGLPGLGNVFIDRLFLDVPKKEFCVEARLTGQTFQIIPSVLSMEDIGFHLCLKKSGRILQRNLNVFGTITLGTISTQATVNQMGRVVMATASIPQRMTIPIIFNAFGGSFIPADSGLAPVLNSKGFNSFGLTDTLIIVNRTGGTGGAHSGDVSITSTADLPGLTASIELLFTGLGTSNKKAVAVFSLPRIELAKVVDLVSGIDISDLPFLGDLALPATTITIANNPLASLPNGFKFTSPLVQGAKLAKGVALNYFQNIGGKLKNFRMNMRPGSFDVTLDELPSLQDALADFFPGAANTDIYKALPKVVPIVFGLKVNRIAYDKDVGKLTIEAALNDFTVIPKLLKISSATVKAEITKANKQARPPTRASLGLSIQGTVGLFGLDLTISIGYQSARKAFFLQITSPTNEIKFKKMFDLIGSAVNDLTNPAVAALKLREASILNPLFEVNQQSQSVSFRVRGRPTITGFGVFTVEALVNTAPRQFILTLNADRFSMGKMIQTLTGLDLSGIPFLGFISGPSYIGVTLSATNVPRIPFPITSYPLNETTSIDRGLGFTVAFRLPENCQGDPICNFFRLLLGDEAILFRITGINGPQATIAYRLPKELKLGAFKLYNVDLGFSVSATRPPTIGLTNIEMDLPVPFPADGQQPLHFRGKLLIDPAQNVEAALMMIGIYERAFGIPFLAFGNVDAGFRTNIACPICVTQLRLGGEIALGTNCYRGNKDSCVIAQAIFNIDAVDVKENWYFFSVNQLSYRKLLTAVGIPDNPALVILDAVSMKDVEASYSSIDRNIPSGILPGGKTIKAGMTFKGKFSVLFLLNVEVDVTVELLFGVPKSLNALVKADPINLGPLKFTAASDSRKGPKFEMKATVLPPVFFVDIDGQLGIPSIGFVASVRAKIDNTGLLVMTTGPILGFQASFTLKAQFTNIKNPNTFQSFQISGRFGTLGASLVGGVRNSLNNAKAAIRRNLDAAIDKLRQADKAVADAVGYATIKGNQERDARRELSNARGTLTNAQNTVNGLCRIRNCNSCQNVPKPCIKQKCFCGLPYPCCRRWRCSTCCKTVCTPYPSTCGYHCVPWVDPVCVAANAGCEIVRKAAFVALEAAKGTLVATEKTVQGAAAATRAAQGAVSSVRVLSRTAQGVSAGIQATFNAVTSAINGLLNAFRINNIGFDVSVDSVGGGSIGVTIDVVVAGTSHRLQETISLRNIAATAEKLARRFYGQFF